MKTLVATLVTAAIVTAGGLYWTGVYDISATDQHLAPTYRLLDSAMRRSVIARAQAIEVPPLEDPALVAEGLVLFDRHCVQCHGAPGVAPEPFAGGMTPAPANLVHTARAWAPAEVYWVIKHGIKMTGMPAWIYRFSDPQIWAVVAFMRTLPVLSPADYRDRVQAAEPPPAVVEASSPEMAAAGDPARGRRAIQHYLCVTCHRIPGIVGSNAPVGPPLDRMATRQFIAGILPNTPENMVRWLRDPQQISPMNAMPDLGVTERDGRDIAAYLYTLE